MSEKKTFEVGQRVTFTTPGRYPREKAGVVEAVGSFLTVKTDDGETLKTRPGVTYPA